EALDDDALVLAGHENASKQVDLRMPRWTCGKTRLDMIPNGVLTTVLEVETIISKMSEGMLRWVWTCQEKATTSSSKESQSPYSRRKVWFNSRSYPGYANALVFVKMEMKGAIGLMRRIPPKHTEKALNALISLLPTHSSHLLSQIDYSLQVLCDMDNSKRIYLM
nr:probable F-actin-capping protein subunit beta [Tanacetum cinerariifolium]